MTALAPLVTLRDVSVRHGSHPALRDISLSVMPGERVAVLGPSGSGKSTLLSLLNGAQTPSTGTVEILGHDLSKLSGRQLRRVRRRVGLVHQRLHLVEQVRVLHNVNAGRLGDWGTLRALAALVWPTSVEDARVALDRVGLGWAVHERTERLSGGERQRVAIARLLLQQPDVVLADEPVSSLDPAHAGEVLRLLSLTGSALLVSLHQPELARAHCTRAIGLRAGELAFDHPVRELESTALTSLYALA